MVLRLKGEWDISRRDELRERSARTVADAIAGDADVVLDLRAADFIDSGVLGIMLNLNRRLTQAGLALRTRCASGSAVTRAIATAGLTDTLGVVED